MRAPNPLGAQYMFSFIFVVSGWNHSVLKYSMVDFLISTLIAYFILNILNLWKIKYIYIPKI
jgi:hypothetical protein